MDTEKIFQSNIFSKVDIGERFASSDFTKVDIYVIFSSFSFRKVDTFSERAAEVYSKQHRGNLQHILPMEDFRRVLGATQFAAAFGHERPLWLQNGERGHHHRSAQKSRRNRRGDLQHGRLSPLAEKRTGLASYFAMVSGSR